MAPARKPGCPESPPPPASTTTTGSPAGSHSAPKPHALTPTHTAPGSHTLSKGRGARRFSSRGFFTAVPPEGVDGTGGDGLVGAGSPGIGHHRAISIHIEPFRTDPGALAASGTRVFVYNDHFYSLFSTERARPRPDNFNITPTPAQVSGDPGKNKKTRLTHCAFGIRCGLRLTWSISMC